MFEILRSFRREKRQFDTVILDPPAFCKSANEVKDAYRGYKDVNINAMKIVKSGGFLITCSCSHYMTTTLFEKMLMEAAKESGRTVRYVEMKTQAPDHPSLLSAEETQYLKFFVLHITPRFFDRMTYPSPVHHPPKAMADQLPCLASRSSRQ